MGYSLIDTNLVCRFNLISTTLQHFPKIVRKRVPLDAIALKSQMKGLLKVVGDLFEQAEQQPSDMVLDEMKLVVEINAEGQVSIMGNGGKLGDRGTIELKFKRIPPA